MRHPSQRRHLAARTRHRRAARREHARATLSALADPPEDTLSAAFYAWRYYALGIAATAAHPGDYVLVNILPDIHMHAPAPPLPPLASPPLGSQPALVLPARAPCSQPS